MKHSSTPLTIEQQRGLENCSDHNSPEAKEIERLDQAESEWLERQDYYHLGYHDCDHL